MNEIVEEIGLCVKCSKDINLSESWRVDEKFYCQDCFEQMDV